jgi:hypothetical protein
VRSIDARYNAGAGPGSSSSISLSGISNIQVSKRDVL